MKTAAVVLCLLITLTTASAAPQVGDNTGGPAPAHVPRVREVRFAGEPTFEPDTLKKVLSRRPAYEPRAVEADLARLRSFYFSQGYLDATVIVANVTIDGGDAIVTFEVQSGPKYLVRHIEIDGIDNDRGATAEVSGGEFHVESLCSSLFDAQRLAETQGQLDFAVELEISRADDPGLRDLGGEWVNVTSRVRPGSAYTVRRIAFSGHNRINESTLRRMMALQERSPFDVVKLRASLARLNRSGLFEPLTLGDVEIRRRPDTLTADVTVAIRERRGRRWSLSGPLGPPALGLLESTISSRLPPWGRGIFEASTYYLTISVTGFSNPLIRLLPIRVRPSPPALLVFERPYLPGQALLSGFAYSPQLSAQRLLAGYGLTHVDRVAQAALLGDEPDSSELVIPISRRHTSAVGQGSGAASVLICNPRARSHQRLRRGAAIAAGVALGAFRPY